MSKVRTDPKDPKTRAQVKQLRWEPRSSLEYKAFILIFPPIDRIVISLTGTALFSARIWNCQPNGRVSQTRFGLASAGTANDLLWAVSVRRRAPPASGTDALQLIRDWP